MVDINIYVISDGRFHRKVAKNEFFFYSFFGSSSRKDFPMDASKEIYSLKEKSMFSEQLNMFSPSPILYANQKEKNIVAQITNKTHAYNRNNITRTQAYYEFFIRNQEVHWSFLAHIVSRNGGYYMTDLKSSYLKDFLSEPQINRYFLFLER